MKVLLTGGAGFIGSHISKLLLDRGDEVVIYDNLSRNDDGNIDKRATFVKGDLKDAKLLVKTLKNIDAVIHMAGFIAVAESVKNPVMFAQNNIIGSVYVLEAMRQAKVKKIIFSSSACVYGTPDKLPIEEGAPLKSDNPYGAGKIAVEKFCETYHNLHGMDVVILRYFNPYGPGERHKPETHAIPNFITCGLKRELIPLYWKGEQIRDFIYVEDLANAHITTLNLSGLGIYNVGTQIGVKVIDVLNKISDILGYRLNIKYLGERRGDVMANFASSKKLYEATGWQAKVGLEEGLKRTIKYFKS